MRPFPRDVLVAQRDFRQLPPQYLGSAAEADLEVPVDRVADSVLRFLVEPPTTQRLESELFESADDETLRRALALPLLREGLAEQGVRRLYARIDRRAAQARAAISQRLDLSKKKHLRIARIATNRSYGWAETRLSSARESLANNLRLADQTTAQLEADLHEAEQSLLAELESQCEQRFGKAKSDEHWLPAAVRRALADGEIERARFLLDQTDESDVIALPDVAPQRGPIPYSDVEEIVRWMNGESAAPRGFLRYWGIVTDDPVSAALCAAITPCVRTDESVGEGVGEPEFRDLVGVLSRILGASNDAPPVEVRRVSGAWAARIPRLCSEGFYAFEGYPNGLLVACAAASRAADAPDAARDYEDSGDEAAPSEDSDYALRTFDEYYLWLGEHPITIGRGRLIHLDWKTLLALVSDRHRARTLVRTLGTYVRPEHAFPEATRRSDANALGTGRRPVIEAMLDGGGPVLWVGPRGSGKTTVVMHAMAEARRRGWHVQSIAEPADIERLAEQVAVGVSKTGTVISELVPPGHAGCLIVSDDVEDLDVEVAAGATARLLALLQTIQDAAQLSRSPIACAATTTPASIAFNSGAPYRFLRALGFDTMCEAVICLLDVTGLAAKPDAIDYVAYASGGHPRLAHMYLRELAGEKRGPRRTAIALVTAADAESQLTQPAVREEARKMLFEPFASGPAERAATFAAVWTETKSSDSARVSVGAVRQWLAGLGLEYDEDAIRTHLLALEASYLLAGDGSTWRLAAGGLAGLLLDEATEAAVQVALDSATTKQRP